MQTPETAAAWDCQHPLHRLSDREKRELCEKIEQERDAVRDTLLLAVRWGISSDGYSAEVSSRIRCWIIGGMKGPAPKAPDYYPQTTIGGSKY